MTKPQKTPRQLAEEHWDQLEPILFTQMKLTMRLFIDGFIEGHNHGKESQSGGRTITPKK